MEVEEVAKFVGTAFATFGGTWALLLRQNKARESNDDEGRKQLRDDVQRQLDELKADVDNIATEMRENFKRLEERAQKFVDSEEFSAYTQHTTASMQKLAEKVGHATGAIDAWYRAHK